MFYITRTWWQRGSNGSQTCFAIFFNHKIGNNSTTLEAIEGREKWAHN